MFLFIAIAACVGLIANRQWELNAAIQMNNDCIDRVVYLKERIGGCGLEQLNELKTCQVDLKKLSEVKGKCLVYEKNIRENSKSLVKRADDLIKLLSKQVDLFAREAKWEAKRKDVCEKHLREVEIEARQLVSQITVLVQEKEQLDSTYRSCVEQLGAYKKAE